MQILQDIEYKECLQVALRQEVVHKLKKKIVCKWKCDACNTLKHADHFDPGILHRAKYTGQQKVCHACKEAGFSPRDVKRYTCIECGPKEHLKFTKQAMIGYKTSIQHTKLTCQDSMAAYKDTDQRLQEDSRRRCDYNYQSRVGRPRKDEARSCDLHEQFGSHASGQV